RPCHPRASEGRPRRGGHPHHHRAGDGEGNGHAEPVSPDRRHGGPLMRVRDVIEWVILGAIWGGSFLFTKVAVPEFGAYAVVAVRLAVAAAVLAVPVFVRREWSHVRAKWGTLLVLGVLNCSIPFTLFAWAMQPRLAADGTIQSFPAGD